MQRFLAGGWDSYVAGCQAVAQLPGETMNDSKKLIFKPSVPQGSPLSPLPFVVFAAGAITRGHVALCKQHHSHPDTRSQREQPRAIDALASKAAMNEVEIAQIRPRHWSSRLTRMKWTQNDAIGLPSVARFSPTIPRPKSFGFHFDSQLRLEPQAHFAVAKLSSQIRHWQVLTGVAMRIPYAAPYAVASPLRNALPLSGQQKNCTFANDP